VNSRAAILTVCLFAIGLSGQPKSRLPQFGDYQTQDTFKGRLVVPLFNRPAEREYRTKIRQGVINGWGVTEAAAEDSRPGPNFAGHYLIIKWPCGSPCMMAAIVDATTGRIFPPPFHGAGDGYFWVPALWSFPAEGPPILDYRINSRLLIAEICEHPDERFGTYYFVMEDSGLRLIRTALRPSSR